MEVMLTIKAFGQDLCGIHPQEKWRARIEKQHIAPKLNIEEIEIFYVSSETGDLYRVFFYKQSANRSCWLRYFRRSFLCRLE